MVFIRFLFRIAKALFDTLLWFVGWLNLLQLSLVRTLLLEVLFYCAVFFLIDVNFFEFWILLLLLLLLRRLHALVLLVLDIHLHYPSVNVIELRVSRDEPAL